MSLRRRGEISERWGSCVGIRFPRQRRRHDNEKERLHHRPSFHPALLFFFFRRIYTHRGRLDDAVADACHVFINGRDGSSCVLETRHERDSVRNSSGIRESVRGRLAYCRWDVRVSVCRSGTETRHEICLSRACASVFVGGMGRVLVVEQRCVVFRGDHRREFECAAARGAMCEYRAPRRTADSQGEAERATRGPRPGGCLGMTTRPLARLEGVVLGGVVIAPFYGHRHSRPPRPWVPWRCLPPQGTSIGEGGPLRRL